MLNNLNKRLVKSLEFVKSIGLDGVQVGISYGKYNVEHANIRQYVKLEKLLNKSQLEISAFCGELGGKGLMEDNKNPIQIAKLRKMIDLAVKMNVHIISTHIGVVPQNTQDDTYITIRKALLEIGEYAMRNRVTIAIETGPEKATVLKGLLDSLPGGIGINLDPANLAMCACDDPVQAVYTLRDYIVHTHAKDGKNIQPVDTRFVYGFVREGDKKMLVAPQPDKPIYEETRLGEGSVDWDNYIAALNDIGYKGYMAIEREYGKNTEKDISDGASLLMAKTNRKPKFTLAVVGCGSIANGAHLPSIKSLSDVRLKYVVDIIKDRADAAKLKFKAEQSLTDYKAILNDKELDGVIICTHTDYHNIIALDCLNHGINVLSEKPVALNYQDAVNMAVTADKCGKVLNIGVCMRFNTAVNRIKSMIDAGLLGNLYHIVCNFRAHRMIPGIGGSFTTKAESGGGVLMDWGIHYLDLILYALGNPNIHSVTGDCYGKIGADIAKYKSNFSWGAKPIGKGIYDVDDYTCGHIRTNNNISISFNGAWAQNIDKKETYIDFLGDKGGIRYNYCSNYIFYTDDLKSNSPPFCDVNMYRQELIDFIKDVRDNNTDTRNNIKYILPTAKLLNDIYLSSATKAEVIND